MGYDEIVRDYRRLLAELPNKVQAFEDPALREIGLEARARGMVEISGRIAEMPDDQVWLLISRDPTQLQRRVSAMREADQILTRLLTGTVSDTSVLLGALASLVGGLPGDDPTDF